MDRRRLLSDVFRALDSVAFSRIARCSASTDRPFAAA
jgi:hypothetical protein